MALDAPREVTEGDVLTVLLSEIKKMKDTVSLQVEGWRCEVDVRLDKAAIAKAILQAIKGVLLDEDDIVRLETCHFDIPNTGVWNEQEGCVLMMAQIRYRIYGEREAIVNHVFKIRAEA